MIILGLDQENKLLAKGGNYMELSIQIKKYRTELHLSQEELAEKVYVTRQTISNWENEKSYPDIHSLLLLSSLFNASLDQLYRQYLCLCGSEGMRIFRLGFYLLLQCTGR